MAPGSSVLIFALFISRFVAAAEIIELQWSTDATGPNGHQPISFGPDGPWQALLVEVNDRTMSSADSDTTHQYTAAMWPSGTNANLVLAKEGGGDYSPPENTFTKVAAYDDPWESDLFAGFVRGESTGVEFYIEDWMQLPSPTGNTSLSVDTSFIALRSWKTVLPDGRNYTPQVGELSLGAGQSLLWDLQRNSSIASRSFGLHIGSVPLGHRGSCILGGYDENRVIGPVGVFDMDQGIPRVTLLDVTIGVEIGDSIFESADVPGSIFRGVPRKSDDDKKPGGKGAAAAATVSVVLNPVTPSIHLPDETCQAAAAYLPVRWDESLKYYLWRVEDPNYERLVNSPAYLGFALGHIIDGNTTLAAANLTIKVPFKLLNLTLEPPVVDFPTPYFPCKPMNGSTSGQLGRAFLQAAFFGINHDQNLLFLAQAPGPKMGPSKLRQLPPTHRSIVTSNDSSDAFADSWVENWVVLNPSSRPTTTTQITTPPSDNSSPGGGFGSKEIAGTLTGVIAGLVLVGMVVAATWFRRRRLRHRPQPKRSATAWEPENTDSAGGEDAPEVAGEVSRGRQEMDSPNTIHEAGDGLPHELEAPVRVHEAPGGVDDKG